MTSWIKTQQQSSPFFGTNSTWLESFYDDYLVDRDSVSNELQILFDKITDNTGEDIRHLPILDKFAAAAQLPIGETGDGESVEVQKKEAAVLRLINSYRVSGHKVADVDPIHYHLRAAVADLDPAYNKLSDADLETEFNTGSLVAADRMKLKDIIDLLKRTYTKHIGYEYMHINAITEREWLQQRIEKNADNFPIADAQKIRLLEELTKAEGMERYLHTKYVGQKRFSLEGGDVLIPQLYELILHVAKAGVKELVIGMAHRGRLNVLVNLLGKSPEKLFKEFEGKCDAKYDNINSGDVKYHMGFSSDIPTTAGDVHVTLAFNPSHLEIINPVVLGSAKARQFRRKNDNIGGTEVFPVLIHGDAAIEGQGVNMELFNMSQQEGYCVGGTLHIVINNQIGFTTTHALDQHIPGYCTEVAKMVQAPIFHVNADDPQAVAFVTEMAADFRTEFKKDVVIDLVCYRRHGHNEADEPSATQPHMYKLIKKHPTPRQIYADILVQNKTVNKDLPKNLADNYRDALDAGTAVVELSKQPYKDEFHVDWSTHLGADLKEPVSTDISKEMFAKLAQIITTIPDGFKPHNRIRKIYDDRIKMMNGELKMDWGFAETMAYASILHDGYQIRIDGQDSQRGTFFHRHAVIHNINQDENYMPLAQLQSDSAKIAIINSVLSEEAVLAFEYGYATSEPNALIIWEAQFGDFANGAQVVIDQFISSGEAKWGRFCGLVMFLPHGYEGQGPEHSSARLERYLQLCAVNNMQVCMPSTPAQMFHLLRRQMLRKVRKPLIVMTPKSLLRYKGAASTLSQLTEGKFQNVIPDRYAQDNNQVERVIICSGKVYYDIINELENNPHNNIAVIRVEQLYPFPRTLLIQCLENYKNIKDVIWCQEEPINQGAWFQIRHHLQHCVKHHTHGDRPLYFAGRHGSPSPAVGSHRAHIQQQNQLVKDAISGIHGSSIDAE
ncbi:2-oxoglutarate dehydrogenase E1 component [hydrothermal vent metagenome]|uniref:2-oxoglutarate dehydrogenase E1 component n=1 Tax=hydrothermal vent metagenome TaxID=652676 RepID=A0A3B0UXG8_9ZZZZ